MTGPVVGEKKRLLRRIGARISPVMDQVQCYLGAEMLHWTSLNKKFCSQVFLNNFGKSENISPNKFFFSNPAPKGIARK